MIGNTWFCPENGLSIFSLRLSLPIYLYCSNFIPTISTNAEIVNLRKFKNLNNFDLFKYHVRVYICQVNRSLLSCLRFTRCHWWNIQVQLHDRTWTETSYGMSYGWIMSRLNRSVVSCVHLPKRSSFRYSIAVHVQDIAREKNRRAKRHN